MPLFLFFTAQEMRGLRAVTAAGTPGARAALAYAFEETATIVVTPMTSFNTAWDILEHEQTLEPADARRFEVFFSNLSAVLVRDALAKARVDPAAYERALAKIRVRAGQAPNSPTI